MCESKELIVGYLYDELSIAEREALQAHLAICSQCSVELEGLRSTRSYLASWSPPVPDLGFRVIGGGGTPVEGRLQRRRFAPLFAFAAAAVIVLAAAAAIANVEMRYGSDGLIVRTGWVDQPGAGPLASQGSHAPGVRAGNSSAPAWDEAGFAELERRLQNIESALPPGPSRMQLASSQVRMSDAELLSQVRQMLGEAQAQQKAAFARQMLQVVRDVQQQHISDIAAIQQGLEHYQGMTNAEIATSRDMFNQWIRASARQENRR